MEKLYLCLNNRYPEKTLRARTFIIFFITSILVALAGNDLPAMNSFGTQRAALSLDTIPLQNISSRKDSIALADSLRRIAALDSMKGYTIYADTTTWVKDTVQRDTAQLSKNSLDFPVQYTASDSITFDMFSSHAYLYGNSHVQYQNLELTADKISISLDSSLVHANGRKDSLGEVLGKPLFRQGE